MIKRSLQIIALCAISSMCLASTISKELPLTPGSKNPISINLKNLHWKTSPSGGKVAYVYGNPDKPGLFILISKSRPSFRKAPHYHNKAVFLTLLRGTFQFGIGNKFIKSKMHTVKAKSLIIYPAGTVHYEWSEGSPIFEIVGHGPWKTFFVDEHGKVIKKNQQ